MPAINILTVGPSPTLMGGMSAVLKQMLQLDFGRRYQLSALPITMASNPSESKPHRILRHVRQRLLLGRTLRTNRFHIAHIHTCSGFSFHRSAWDLRVAKKSGLRTVLHMHGARFDDYFDKAGHTAQGMVRRTLRMADCVIALSHSWMDRLRKIEPGANLCVIENAVGGPENRPRRPVHPVCRFLMLGRMDAWKGVEDLLTACTLLKKWGTPFNVTLAGPEGSAGNASEIRRKIGTFQLQDCVNYLGSVEGAAKESLLAASDALVQPSHHEGMPISILEAFAHELPVVATRVGAVPEVLDHEVHGLLTPPQSPLELARAMSVVAIDPPYRQMMGVAARRLAETRFSLTRFRDELVELYDELLVHSRRPANPARTAEPDRPLIDVRPCH